MIWFMPIPPENRRCPTTATVARTPGAARKMSERLTRNRIACSLCRTCGRHGVFLAVTLIVLSSIAVRGSEPAVPKSPAPPTPVGPAGRVTGTTHPNFTWETGAGAVWHRVFIRKSPPDEWDFSTWTRGTSWRCGWHIRPGKYEWWVQAWRNGQKSPWSEAGRFHVRGDVLPTPTAQAPSGRIETCAPLFQWESVAGAAWYNLFITKKGGWKWQTWLQAPEWQTAGWRFQKGEYEWSVRAWNEQGYGPQSSATTFVVEDPFYVAFCLRTLRWLGRHQFVPWLFLLIACGTLSVYAYRYRRKYGKQILLGAASTLFSFALCGELLFRFRVAATPFRLRHGEEKLPSHLTEKDRTLRWRPTPGNRSNSLGLKHGEIGEKEETTFRVLFLGDSLVNWGKTSSGELYTQSIENGLNRRFSLGGKKFEVINAGVPGYTTYQELELLKLYGLDLAPDAVILGYVFNDVYHRYLHRISDGSQSGFEPTIHLNRFDTDHLPGKLLARSYLAHGLNFIAGNAVRQASGRPTFPFETKDDFYLAWKDYGWRNARLLLQEMRDVLHAQGIAFKVVSFPVRDQVDDHYLQLDREYVLYPQTKLQSICTDLDIRLFDLTPTIHAHGGTSLYRDYVHLTPPGNTIVAETLSAHIADWLGTLLGQMPTPPEAEPAPGKHGEDEHAASRRVLPAP